MKHEERGSLLTCNSQAYECEKTKEVLLLWRNAGEKSLEDSKSACTREDFFLFLRQLLDVAAAGARRDDVNDPRQRLSMIDTKSCCKKPQARVSWICNVRLRYETENWWTSGELRPSRRERRKRTIEIIATRSSRDKWCISFVRSRWWKVKESYQNSGGKISSLINDFPIFLWMCKIISRFHVNHRKLKQRASSTEFLNSRSTRQRCRWRSDNSRQRF